jgi:hypothetical protein
MVAKATDTLAPYIVAPKILKYKMHAMTAKVLV